MKFTYGKREKLKSKKSIERLFTEGNSVSAYPLRMVFLKEEASENFPFLAGVSVPKRKVKKAVNRNKIKRMMREAYRFKKSLFIQSVNAPYICMFLYLESESCSLDILCAKMEKLAAKFQEKIQQIENC